MFTRLLKLSTKGNKYVNKGSKNKNRLVNQAVLVKQFLYSEMFMFVMLSIVVWLSDVIPSSVHTHGVTVSVQSWQDQKV